jgi:hypothetical protein
MNKTEQFVEKAKKIHGETYDYSGVQYVVSAKKVEIRCGSHGAFLQTPNSHLNGSGCPKCGDNRIREKMLSSTDEFIAKARMIHGDRYGYSMVRYTSAMGKVEIQCSVHGFFRQTPNKHLDGSGCYRCGRDKSGEARIGSTEEFLMSAREVHGDRYDYSLVEYKTAREKVRVICKTHGEFLVSPDNHLGKSVGCWRCSESHGETAVARWLDCHNLKYEKEKTFIGCVNPSTGHRLRFDFYLPDVNMCIEFDGAQHFHEVKYKKFEGSFRELRMRDGLKDSFCDSNHIPLVRIPYTHLGKIDMILSERLLVGSMNS